MQILNHKFRKEERLCSRKAIEELFGSGKSFFSHPFQVIWMNAPTEFPYPAQVAVSVSKKLFKRAVRRNLIKRRMREAYRRNKTSFYQFLADNNTRIIFIIIYKSNTIADFTVIEKSMQDMLKKLAKIVKEQVGNC